MGAKTCKNLPTFLAAATPRMANVIVVARVSKMCQDVNAAARRGRHGPRRQTPYGFLICPYAPACLLQAANTSLSNQLWDVQAGAVRERQLLTERLAAAEKDWEGKFSDLHKQVRAWCRQRQPACGWLTEARTLAVRLLS